MTVGSSPRPNTQVVEQESSTIHGFPVVDHAVSPLLAAKICVLIL